MKYFSSLLIVLLASVGLSNLNAQNKVTLSGYVKDSANGEALGSSSISVEGNTISTQTNMYGFYSLSLSPGSYTILISNFGFKTEKFELEILNNITKNIDLSRTESNLKNAVVKGKKKENQVEKVEMSTNNLNIIQIKKVPALLGEVDIVKSVQLLPGVSTVGEGATGFNVRGGSIDQNLILLD